MIRGLKPVFGALALLASAEASAAVAVNVAKSPYCGCCEQWIAHMRAAGFQVIVHNVEDATPIATRLGVPVRLRSCHTAKVGNYVIEGHVPAADVKRLLREHPNAIGLAVPGMPQGAPGMEQGSTEPFNTILFTKAGAKVFASH